MDDQRSPRLAAAVFAVLALVDAAAVAAVVAWAVGRLVSDAFAWSQWLSWIPTLAVLPVALIGLGAAARPTRRRPPAQRRRMVVWTAVVAALATHLVLVDNRLVGSRCEPAAGGTTALHWNMTARRSVPVRTLAEVLVRENADLTIMTNPPLLFGDPAFRAWTEGRTAQIVEPFGVVTTLVVRRFRPLLAADGIHLALLELQAPWGHDGETLVLWLLDLPSDPRAPRRAIVERVRRLIARVDAPTPDLIVGDLNMLRGSRSMQRLAPGYTSAFALAGTGIGASFPRRWPLQHIDHVLVRPGMPVACYRLDDPGVGKHRVQRFTFGRATQTTNQPAVSSTALRSTARAGGSPRAQWDR